MLWAFLVAQLVKSPPAMQETPVQFLGWKDPLKKGKATLSCILVFLGFPSGPAGKESACNAGDLSSIPGLERSLAGGHGNHSSILAWKIPMNRGSWQNTVHGVARVRHN